MPAHVWFERYADNYCVNGVSCAMFQKYDTLQTRRGDRA